MDWRLVPFHCSIGFSTNGNTTGFTIQYTYDDPNNFASAASWNSSGVWYTLNTMSAMTAQKDGTIDFSVQGIRVQANSSGTDTGTVTLIQGQQL
jgi:hypothetical protein